jgi:hypothetical protein
MDTSPEYTTLELDLTEDQKIIFDIIIKEGMLQEQERIIKLLNNLYNVTCCCDSASFGEHYLAHKQPDNLIDMIRKSSAVEIQG